MKLILGALLCVSLCIVPINSVNNRLKEIFAWKVMDYSWEKPEDRDAAIASGEFVPENNLPLGLEVWKDKLFITIPRWKNGVVATLNYVKITDDEDETSPTPTEDPTTPDLTEKTPESSTTAPPSTTPEIPTTQPPPTTPFITTEGSTTTASANDEPTVLPEGSILPMPARMFDSDDIERREVLRRVQRSPGEDDEDEDEQLDEELLQMKSLFRKSSLSSRKSKDKEDNEKDGDEKKEKSRKKKKHDGDEEKDKKKEKSKKNKDKKDKDSKEKEKKKKKCKPKPKPTTEAPVPPPSPETPEATETTAGTTASPPPAPRSPALIPYPSFAANRVVLGDAKPEGPKPIVSVFRVWADTCDRLWVMDTGVADILGKTAVVSKPKILIYNLNNDELIKSFEFKDADSEEHSFFANIVVEADPKNCDKAFAYIPDLGGYAIISYDLANDKTRRIKHNYFHFDPLAGNMEVGGVNFQWTDGVFSIALSKPKEDGFRTAYFHCLASTKEFSVDTKVLQSPDSSSDSFYDYKLVGDRGEKSQSSASYIHEDTGIMFYTQLQKDSVNCWNTNKPLTPENIVEVASDNETMIFTNDLKVDKEGNLWVLTDKLPVFIYKGLDDSEVNYRIFTASVDEAVAGTNCAP